MKVVYNERGLDYGTPLENHTRTARLWSIYLGKEVTARDVCMLNILQKISRDQHAPKFDNLVDIAGYAENAFLIEHPGNRAAEEPTSLSFYYTTPAVEQCLQASTRKTNESPSC